MNSKKFLIHKSDEEKIDIAQKQIRETMLKLITDAEQDYDEWKLAGSIKRAQVIDKIFANYPILSKVTDQKESIKWIDDASILQASSSVRCSTIIS